MIPISSVSVVSTKKYPTPQKGLVQPGHSPKLNPYPNIQYVIPPNMTSEAFFTKILISFLIDTDPASKRPNPKINKDKNMKYI